MELNGIPLHPLVVHGAVVLVPLGVLVSWLLAVLPSWRWLTRWGALLLSAGGLAAIVLARATGSALLDDRSFLVSQDSTVRDTMLTHQDRSLVLLVLAIANLVVVVLAWWLLPARTGLASGRLDHGGRDGTAIRLGLPAALLVLGALVLVWTVLTGDAGSRAVWGG